MYETFPNSRAQLELVYLTFKTRFFLIWCCYFVITYLLIIPTTDSTCICFVFLFTSLCSPVTSQPVVPLWRTVASFADRVVATRCVTAVAHFVSALPWQINLTNKTMDNFIQKLFVISNIAVINIRSFSCYCYTTTHRTHIEYWGNVEKLAASTFCTNKSWDKSKQYVDQRHQHPTFCAFFLFGWGKLWILENAIPTVVCMITRHSIFIIYVWFYN